MSDIKMTLTRNQLGGLQMAVQEWLDNYEGDTDMESYLHRAILGRLFKKVAEKMVVRKAQYSFKLPMEQCVCLVIHFRYTAYESEFMQMLQSHLIHTLAPKFETIN